MVTGASSGIGLAAAVEFARRGWVVALVGRDRPGWTRRPRGTRGRPRPRVDSYRCDFAVLDEVRDLAGTLRTAYPRIDVLANNAGGLSRADASTVDGFEATIQSNHLAPFLLSHELREPSGRADHQHRVGGAPPGPARPGRPQRRRSRRYRAAAHLRRHQAGQHPVRRRGGPALAGDPVDLVPPGRRADPVRHDSPVRGSSTASCRRCARPEQGADTLVWLATEDTERITPGGYYVDRRERRPSRPTTDPTLAARLWEVSLAAVGLA